MAALCYGGQTPEKRKLKILVNSPALGWSHMQYQGRLADVLTEAGHEVHILTFEMSPLIGNYSGVTKGQRVRRVQRSSAKRDDMLKMKALSDTYGGSQNMLLDGFMDQFNEFTAGACEELLTMDNLIDQLAEEKYDLAISEMFDYCMFGLFHAIRVPIKLASYAAPLNSMAGEVFGIPSFSSYVTNLFVPSMNGPEMTFIERAQNFLADAYVHLFMKRRIYDLLQPLFHAKYGSSFPELKGLVRDASLFLVNGNEFFELPKPISNKVIYVGGIVESKTKKLTKEFSSLMESPSSDGVVLFSFGTVADVKTMTPEMRRAFISAFSHFPSYDFIWKFAGHRNYSSLFADTPNVHPFEWVDQRSLLSHPRLRAFITHCGMNSMSEGARAGVPMVGIPLFGDQLFNSVLMNYKGIGEYLDIRLLEDERHIIGALGKVLGDGSYAERAKSLSRKLALTPFPPAERLVKWVEFAAEFPDGLKELNLPSEEEMGLLVYYSLDVISVSLLAGAILLVGAYWAAKLLLALAWSICNNSSGEKKKKAD